MTEHEPLVRDWLRSFMPLVSTSNISADEVRLRINALAARLAANFPAEAFNDRSFEAVARRLKFFPSYAEVVEPLNAWLRDRKPTFGLQLSDHRAYEPPPKPAARTPHELQHVSSVVRRILGELDQHHANSQAYYASKYPNWQETRQAQMTRAELSEAYRRAGLKGPQ